jgi:hypothetical protein
MTQSTRNLSYWLPGLLQSLMGTTFFGCVDGNGAGTVKNSGTVSMNYPADIGPVPDRGAESRGVI